MRKAIKQTVLILPAILVATTIYAQDRTEYCQVSAYWWDHKAGVGSAFHILDKFAVSVGADPVVKTFDFYETGLKVTIGVRFGNSKGIEKGMPDSIEQAIAVATSESKNIFEAVDSSIAEAAYGKKWPGLSVTKMLNYEQRLYTFSLSCGGRVKPHKR